MSAISALAAHPVVANAAIKAVGTVPPGVQGNLSKIVNWIMWGGGVALIVAFAALVAKGGFSALKHGQMEHQGAAVGCLALGVFLVAGPTLFKVFGISF